MVKRPDGGTEREKRGVGLGSRCRKKNSDRSGPLDGLEGTRVFGRVYNWLIYRNHLEHASFHHVFSSMAC